MTTDLQTIKLEKLIYGGDALGRLPDGRAVFVPFALPGETVCIRPLEQKRGHARAELVNILEPSPDRISPKCVHFGICGGCHYQHMSYPDQLNIKTEILRDQLTRIGKIKDPPVGKMIPSPSEWNYRNHIQFHLTENGKPGYIDAIDRNVFPITECHLPVSIINELWPRLDFDPGLRIERISLRAGMDEETMLMLEGESPHAPQLELETSMSVVHLAGKDGIVMAGDDYVMMGVNDRQFQVSAASFFQVNTEMAGKMVDHLLSQLPVAPAATILDIYCGVGLFSAFFAPRTGRLMGIESSQSACEDFTLNLDEFENVELYAAPAEEVLPALSIKPKIVIVDPPRQGLGKQVLDGLQAFENLTIAYVSCDPSTLARDAARLIAGGFRLVQVTPIDMFPQTFHIESISKFEKR
jgi:23S rRNA (uracil1939-C5)-methyltransferase